MTFQELCQPACTAYAPVTSCNAKWSSVTFRWLLVICLRLSTRASFGDIYNFLKTSLQTPHPQTKSLQVYLRALSHKTTLTRNGFSFILLWILNFAGFPFPLDISLSSSYGLTNVSRPLPCNWFKLRESLPFTVLSIEGCCHVCVSQSKHNQIFIMGIEATLHFL